MMTGAVQKSEQGLGFFGDLQREMDGLFGRWVHGDDTPPQSVFRPALNVAETEQAYEVSLDLPGVDPQEIEVEVKDGQLWISGKREIRKEETDKKWHRVECRFGQFRRGVRLGDDADHAQVDAEYKDGVLHIQVPKLEEAQPRKVEIRH